MSLVPANASVIVTLNNLSLDLNRYLSIIILLFGTLGNLLNCLALSQRTLRSNPCASFFLASSLASLVTLISGVAVRLLAGWGADLTDTVNWLCKLRVFVLFNSRTIASWLIMLATFDRWLSSSPHASRRRISSLKSSQRGMMAVVVLSSLAYAQIFYCYEANLTNAPLKCYGKTTWCRLLIDSEFTSISILIPSILMFFFGFLTISNMRRTTRQVNPIPVTMITQIADTKTHPRRLRKVDRRLLSMLLIQVLLLTLFPLPQAIQNLYANVTRFQVKSPMYVTINNFVFNLFLLLTYVTNGMPFYIYTLTGGAVFRQALFTGTRSFLSSITCRAR